MDDQIISYSSIFCAASFVQFVLTFFVSVETKNKFCAIDLYKPFGVAGNGSGPKSTGSGGGLKWTGFF